MVTHLTVRAAVSRRPGASLRYCDPGCTSSARSPRLKDLDMNTERERLLANVPGPDGWQHWGPYLSERQWGTVREDYSPGGTAWEYFPHDHARSRAYRWGEDGIAGMSRCRSIGVPVAGAVERLRSDIEGAPVRPDQRRRQSRRGRQGALLLPGCHADAFLLEDAVQISAARLSLCAAGGGERPPRHRSCRSTNCWTRACSPRTATSMCSSSTHKSSPATS